MNGFSFCFFLIRSEAVVSSDSDISYLNNSVHVDNLSLFEERHFDSHSYVPGTNMYMQAIPIEMFRFPR